MSEPSHQATGPTTAQLKADIDAGLTGDKVPEFDPSAAPLGTDDEAAGRPASPERIAHARAMELQYPPGTQSSSGPARERRPAALSGGKGAWLILAAVAAILVLGMFWIMARR